MSPTSASLRYSFPLAFRSRSRSLFSVSVSVSVSVSLSVLVSSTHVPDLNDDRIWSLCVSRWIEPISLPSPTTTVPFGSLQLWMDDHHHHHHHRRFSLSNRVLSRSGGFGGAVTRVPTIDNRRANRQSDKETGRLRHTVVIAIYAK